MDYQEKRSLILTLNHIAISTIYFTCVFISYANLTSGSDLLSFWAKTIVLMIPVFVISHLLILFIFTFINKRITGDGFPKFIDERDKLIELKAIRVEYFCVIFGIFASMAALWTGSSVTITFMILISGMVASGLLSQITKFFLYRLSS